MEPAAQSCSCPDQPLADRVANQTGRLVDLELLHDVTSVGLSRFGRDRQERRNLFRGLSFGNQLDTCRSRGVRGLRGTSVFARKASTTVCEMPGLKQKFPRDTSRTAWTRSSGAWVCRT